MSDPAPPRRRSHTTIARAAPADTQVAPEILPAALTSHSAEDVPSPHVNYADQLEKEMKGRLSMLEQAIINIEGELHGSQDETDKRIADIEFKARQEIAELSEKQIEKDAREMRRLDDLRLTRRRILALLDVQPEPVPIAPPEPDTTEQEPIHDDTEEIPAFLATARAED